MCTRVQLAVIGEAEVHLEEARREEAHPAEVHLEAARREAAHHAAVQLASGVPLRYTIMQT